MGERRETGEKALLPAEQSLCFIDERGEKVALRFEFESERRFFIAKAHARIHIQQWREERKELTNHLSRKTRSSAFIASAEKIAGSLALPPSL